MLSVAKMNENLLDILDQQSIGSLEDKIRYYLEYQKDSLQSVFLNISHQTPADELNISREYVSCKLKKLEEIGYLRLSRSKIILV